MKKTALVIAPGRGTYNKPELGYLSRYHGSRKELIETIDSVRAGRGQTSIQDLDAREVYSIKEHTRGDNASTLIYACAYGDFLSIDREAFDIVAVTGNSMGWYIALGCAGALDVKQTATLINTMGTFMQDALIGGQIVYPFVDENWLEISGKRAELASIVESINEDPACQVYSSIELGGMIVYGANEAGIAALQKRLPPLQDRFPLLLPNHAAFHTKLQNPISQKALGHFSADIFGAPGIPMIDGRGHIWGKYSTDPRALFEYTLGHQVCEYYDFTRAVQVGMKEFAPDCIICLGPGTTLGGAIAQSLIGIQWDGLSCKDDFSARQKSDTPILYAMGMDDQRRSVLKAV